MGLIAAADFLNVRENPTVKKANENSGYRQNFMRRIGVFELIDGEYVGHIATLNFKCKAIIKDNPYRKSGKDPEHIVVHADAEIFHHDLGYGWDKKTESEDPYILVQLDDPAFPKTISAVLVKGGKNTYNLYWDRVMITDGDIERLIITEELIPWIGVYRPIDNPNKDYLIAAYADIAEIWDPD
jgi:uncharacterized protein (DUF736 family)